MGMCKTMHPWFLAPSISQFAPVAPWARVHLSFSSLCWQWLGAVVLVVAKAARGARAVRAVRASQPRRRQPQWHIIKASLRPFASATGSPFYTGRSQSDADLLSTANIMENKLEPYASEIVNRLGLAVSEAGGTVSMGSELLEKYAADPAEVATKLGIQGVTELLQSEAGKAFV